MIRIQNIYYMLAYAFQVLQTNGYASLGAEQFQNTADLLSAILARGISLQIKHGIGRDYVEESGELLVLRGKINLSESMKVQARAGKKLVCDYDEFSVDTKQNRILKATMNILLRSDADRKRKKALRNLILYFQGVADIDIRRIDWNMRFDRNNQTYRMLMAVCWLVLQGMIQTQSDGFVKMLDFLDEQRMCRLYEKFILEYYRKEHPMLHAEAAQIDWKLDTPESYMLPVMQSDVMLTYQNKTLILDAKYYAHTTQIRYEAHTIHSSNLYQIFTYVKNQAAKGGEVSGMLLYAKTDEAVQPDADYMMDGNQISVKTLNLDCEFSEVAGQLDAIAEQFIKT